MDQSKNVSSIQSNDVKYGYNHKSGRGSMGQRWPPSDSTNSTSDRVQYEAVEGPSARLARFFNPRSLAHCKDRSFASAFNSWVGVYDMLAFNERIQFNTNPEKGKYRVTLTGKYASQDRILSIKGYYDSNSISNAREHAYRRAMQSFLASELPGTQMDTEQGDVVQESDRAGNTIVTRDAAQTVSEEKQVMPYGLLEICSTEPVHTFSSVMDRWMALDGLQISTSYTVGTQITTYDLPSFLYNYSKAPNLMPLRNFVYGSYDIEFKFVVNANKFHVGKVLISLKYDSYQMGERRNNVVAALCRPHVILDLAVNNEGVLSVPFKYHRTFVRNAYKENSQFGLKHARYATVYVQILSPLQAIAGAPQSMYIRPFYRIKQAFLTGMNHEVALSQGDDLNLESLLKAVGSIANLDRPTDLQRQTQVIPKSRLHFCAGKAPIDSIPMRMDPSTLTTYLSDHKFPEDPKDMLDIARIWGLAWTFKWNVSAGEGSILADQLIDPTYHCNQVYSGTPTPLEYVCSMYQFWSGPIDLRLDFVSNAFHSGSVMLSVELGRSSSDLNESSSTYTKVFHLGDQKSCTFTIPYIYDTPYRRTSCIPWCNLDRISTPEKDFTGVGQVGLYQKVSARFKIRVVNKLVPIQSVPQAVEVLVFWRAGSNFHVHSPIMANLVNSEVSGRLMDLPGSYPVTQMDTGDKEDLDPTATFSEGVPRNFVMSTDKHTNIKDLLRRPVQIISRYKMGKYMSSDESCSITAIPCMPPSRMCGYVQSKANADKSDNQFYARGLTRSYHMHILDLFRFWRGSQRFTILTHNQTPLFVAYIPHSGARLTKDLNFPVLNLLVGKDPNMETNPSTMGLATEIIIPSINPSAVIEVPFELETNFALMQEQYNEDNFSWRDKGETNAGHLLIWSNTDTQISVWWSAGDDFEVSNFYGIPPCNSFTSRYFKDDNHPVTQMDDRDEYYDAQDFSDSEYPDNHLDLKSKVMNAINDYRTPLMMAAASVVPVVGTKMATVIGYNEMRNKVLHVGDAVQQTNEQLQTTLGHVGGLVKTATTVVERASAQMDDVVASTSAAAAALAGAANEASMVAEDTRTLVQQLTDILSLKGIQTTGGAILDMITERISSFVEFGTSLYHTVLNTVLDIFIGITEFSPRALAFSILRFIGNTLSLTFSALQEYVEPIVRYIKQWFSATSQGGLATEHLSAGFFGEDMLKQGLGLFTGMLGTILGISVDRKENETWSLSVLRRLTSAGGMSFLNGTMRFVETIFSLVKEATFKVLSWFSLENRALTAMREKSKIINDFVEESHLMLNEINSGSFSRPDMKTRFWVNVVNAYEIQKILVQVGTSKVSPILSKLCADVIKAGKEKMADLKSSPVRYEPFVICIEGYSKVGKSFLTTFLATELLQAVGYRASMGNPIYYRIQGSKFWNDYTDQPCVVIDEWMNLSDPEVVLEGLRELYQLKSPAVFIPEQAAIEEKKIRANPKVVILLTNNPFPTHLIDGATMNPEAVYRRRDVLIKAVRKAEYADVDLHAMPQEEKDTFKHLEFKYYPDVTKNEDLGDTGFMSYTEFMEDITARFVEYDRQESENVRVRMSQLQKFWGKKTYNLTDPFALFYQGINYVNEQENTYLPSELLELEVEKIVRAVNSIEEQAPTNAVATEGWISGILTTMAVWGVKQFIEYLADYKAPAPHIQCVCCKCGRTAGMYGCCPTSYERFTAYPEGNDLHILCRACCIGNAQIIESGCPLCGDNSFIPIVPAEDLGVLKSLWKLRKAGQSISQVLRYVPTDVYWVIENMVELFKWAFLCTTPTYNVLSSDTSGPSIVLRIVSLGVSAGSHYLSMNDPLREKELYLQIVDHINMIKLDPNHTLTEADERLYRNELLCPKRYFSNSLPFAHQLRGVFEDGQPVPSDKNVYRVKEDFKFLGKNGASRLVYAVPVAQGEPTPTILHRRTLFRPTTQQLDPKGYTFNKTLFDEEWKNPEPSTNFKGDPVNKTCRHDDLIQDISSYRYEEGLFVKSQGTHFDKIEWRICSDFCMLSEAPLEDMCREYFDTNSIPVHSVIMEEFDKQSFKNGWRSRIPSFMWPSWLQIHNSTVQFELTEESWLSKLTIPDTIRTLLKGIGVTLAIFATFKGVKMAYELFFGKPKAQIISSGDQVIRKFKPTPKPRVHAPPASQGTCEDAITGHVMRNYFVFRITNKEDGTYKQCVGLGVRGRMGIIPRHYYRFMQNLDKSTHLITLGPAIEANHGIGYTFCETDFLVSDVSDLAVFYTPTTYPMFKDISKYFGCDADLNAKHSEYAKMVKVPSKTEPYMTVIELKLQGYKKTQTIVGVDGAFTSLDNICYNYSQPGACGSVIMYHNHTRPIRGIHIAGIGKTYGGTGFAAIITQEDLACIEPNPNTPIVQGLEEPDFVEDNIKMYLPEESIVVYKGSVPKNLIPYNPEKSAIKPSKIHNDLPWQTTKAPAILSKKDKRYTHSLSPLLAGCAKHGKLTHDFATDQLNEVAEIRRTQLLSMKPLITAPKKLSVTEAVIGLPDLEHYEGIKMNTSAGWPYCTTNRTTKAEWTTIIRDNQEKPIDCIVDREVLDELQRKTELRKQGIVPMTLFVDTLKDEKKAIEKVARLGGTRVFCASPYDFTIAMRQNFLHFVASYYANRDRMKHSVGISMVGHEVTQLVTDLLSVGENIITLDYSNFGPGFNGGVGGLIKQTILPWLTHYVEEICPAEVESLIEENINSHHLMAGTIYQQRGGSPSGSPITVVINSEVNIMYIMLAWLNIVKISDEKNRWQEFEDHVALRVYGDDLIMAVSDAYIEEFNGITITEFFKTYGIVATDAAKTGQICKSSTIFEASYLKHTFRPHPTRPGEWIAALDLDSVKDTPLWIQEAIQIDEATRVNAEAGIRNAYGHGPEYFKAFKDHVNKALIKHDIPPILVTWKELDDNFYNNKYLIY